MPDVRAILRRGAASKAGERGQEVSRPDAGRGRGHQQSRNDERAGEAAAADVQRVRRRPRHHRERHDQAEHWAAAAGRERGDEQEGGNGRPEAARQPLRARRERDGERDAQPEAGGKGHRVANRGLRSRVVGSDRRPSGVLHERVRGGYRERADQHAQPCVQILLRHGGRGRQREERQVQEVRPESVEASVRAVERRRTMDGGQCGEDPPADKGRAEGEHTHRHPRHTVPSASRNPEDEQDWRQRLQRQELRERELNVKGRAGDEHETDEQGRPRDRVDRGDERESCGRSHPPTSSILAPPRFHGAHLNV